MNMIISSDISYTGKEKNMGISINGVKQAMETYQSINVNTREHTGTKEIIREDTTGNSQTAASYDAVSAYGDTLTISAGGRAAGTNSSCASEDSTDNLSEYTESELKQMYLDGTITKTEYEEELESRA